MKKIKILLENKCHYCQTENVCKYWDNKLEFAVCEPCYQEHYKSLKLNT